ncbi:MAG: hypothetical protein ACPGJV_06135 [Bacteriovoracaceae bacterium]
MSKLLVLIAFLFTTQIHALEIIELNTIENEFDEENDKRHHVFFLHGLHSNGDTFGDLPELVKEKYPKVHTPKKLTNGNILEFPTKVIDPKNKDKVLNEYSIDKSSAIIYSRIVNYFVEEGLSPDEPFSIIAHSLGGIVSTNMILKCFTGNTERCSYEKGLNYLRDLNHKSIQTLKMEENLEKKKSFRSYFNIQHLITLGSPFWGAPTPNKVANWDAALGFVNKFGGSLAIEQMKALKTGSNSLVINRRQILGSSTEEWTNPFPFQLKIYNIAGVIAPEYVHKDNSDRSLKEILTDKVSQQYFKLISASDSEGKHQVETDAAVEAMDARLDFIYHVETEDYQTGEILTKTGRTKVTQAYIPIVVSHMKLPSFASKTNIHSMANITRDKSNNNASYHYIDQVLDQYFRGGELEVIREEVIPPKTFTTEIMAIVPEEFRHRKLDFTNEDYVSVKAGNSAIALAKQKDILTGRYSGQNTESDETKAKGYHTFYSYGKFKEWQDEANLVLQHQNADNKALYEGKIDYEFNFPGFEKKTTSLSVAQSFTSFAKLIFKPYQPLNGPVDVALYSNRYFDVLSILDDERLILFNRASKSVMITNFNKLSTNIKENYLQGLKDKFTLNSGEDKKGKSCFVGKIGEFKEEYTSNKSKASTSSPNFKYDEYASFNDLYEHGSTTKDIDLRKEDELYIVGRVKMNDDKEVTRRGVKQTRSMEFDRYLVVKPSSVGHTGVWKYVRSTPVLDNDSFVWVNASDIDIIKDATCDFSRI